MSLSYDKTTLRKLAKERRASRTPEERHTLDTAICQHILSSPLFLEADMVFLYMPVRGEIDILPIAKEATSMGKVIGVPLTAPGGVMTFHEVKDTHTLTLGAYGIPEPQETAPLLTATPKTLMLVPGLMFDRCGQRIGYGGGYYDRYLHAFLGVSLGTSYEGDLTENLPCEEYDKAVAYVATEQGIYQTQVRK